MKINAADIKAIIARQCASNENQRCQDKAIQSTLTNRNKNPH